jgi:hypothetical protein
VQIIVVKFYWEADRELDSRLLLTSVTGAEMVQDQTSTRL